MNLAKTIDHTILKADATTEQVKKYCAEAREYCFHSICVNTCHIGTVVSELKGTDITPCVVVGFPLGAMLTSAKAFEASEAVKLGAKEVDMVINVGGIKDGNWDFVRDDIKAVVEASKPAIVKVIIETCLLTDEEKVKACQLSEEAGARFVKTSTGFSTAGATVSDVKLMKETVGDRLQIKASGGIHTKEFAEELIAAGADRIGASNGVKIVN
ncbi:deoxyribose-phosphate aldolase [Oribacterium sp. WCC10]|uniref:deoxyribose-phosphate aldolase n=1 Tax=Oribacterium sp. WCC10 TaxID=1855343 RepID=UPI0008EC47CD|nr:deoxyribose-phosphate aldolase [Oribacterium sp. WCC10]SFG51302.1 deoxyribose-phosphate aldolase [Oribacterium sp. WCC10]